MGALAQGRQVSPALLADGLPEQLLGAPIDPDYRHMVRFEAGLLRAGSDAAAGPLVEQALGALFGPVWRRGPERAVRALLWFYRGGQDTPPSGATGSAQGPLAYDFVCDGALIAAAFAQAYGLDLTHPATRLHWWRFRALLLGLPESTVFARVVGWRTADLTGMKGGQLKFYQAMRQKYALPPGLGGDPHGYVSKAERDAAFLARLRARAAS